MTTARTFWKNCRWSILVETSMTSSDSGVVSRQSGGSANDAALVALGRVAVPASRPSPTSWK